ncbi:hypothetical protein [Streptomyces sp. NPDC127114]|uniref:hypothetical protein n=1 Tax=Streptomyces sp. NPDC127114 TaxID=3345366 RepID=UPI003642CAF7
METARSRRRAAPGALASFARFTLCGGGIGVASSFAVAALGSWIPWVLANALVTVVSTLLATELHARFSFGAGGRATWRQHAQSAGSAAAAYAVTCAAMVALRQLVEAPDAALEQGVYLSASALAGVARFAVLRLVVFARNRSEARAPDAPAASADPFRRELPAAARTCAHHTKPVSSAPSHLTQRYVRLPLASPPHIALHRRTPCSTNRRPDPTRPSPSPSRQSAPPAAPSTRPPAWRSCATRVRWSG